MCQRHLRIQRQSLPGKLLRRLQILSAHEHPRGQQVCRRGVGFEAILTREGVASVVIVMDIHIAERQDVAGINAGGRRPLLHSLKQGDGLYRLSQAIKREATHLCGLDIFAVLLQGGSESAVCSGYVVLRIECDAAQTFHSGRLRLLKRHLIQLLQGVCCVPLIDEHADGNQVSRGLSGPCSGLWLLCNTMRQAPKETKQQEGALAENRVACKYVKRSAAYRFFSLNHLPAFAVATPTIESAHP